VCGSTPVESHHLAGRANHALTVPVCATHHGMLTRLQRLWRVPLSEAERSEVEQLSILAVGLFHLMMLATASDRESDVVGMLSSILADISPALTMDARTLAHALSLSPSTPNAWPIMMPHDFRPTSKIATADRVRELSSLISNVASIVCQAAGIPTDNPKGWLGRLLTSVQDDPSRFVAWIESLESDALDGFDAEARAMAESYLDRHVDMADAMCLYFYRALEVAESIARRYAEASHD
jgi:hypothetical protein